MRKKSVLIFLVILAFGLIGTVLSTLYQQNEYIITTGGSTLKVSCGFPLGWYGNSQTETWTHWIPRARELFPEVYWFSLESFLLDAAFWFAISFFVCIATMKSVNILHKTRASKILSVVNI